MTYANWSRVSTHGQYLCVYHPTHPRAYANGYVLAHRAVIEESLGRYLEPHEVIHHKNENKRDNRIENLEITNRSDHAAHHHPQPAPAIILTCPHCSKTFTRRRGKTHLVKRTASRTYCSRRCSGLHTVIRMKNARLSRA